MPKTDDVLARITKIVSGYIHKNAVPQSDVSKLVFSIHQRLSGLTPEASSFSVDGVKSAVPINESIAPDYIICLEDGKRFKSLKRHLRAQYDLSAEQYRERWGLPPDYPMIAPNYAKERSQLARKSGVRNKEVSTAKFETPYKQTDIALTTLHSISDVVICTDVAFLITFMNPAAERVTGWDASDAIGRPIAEVLRLREESSGNAYPCPAHRCIQTDSDCMVEKGVILLSRTGVGYDVGFSAAPVRTPEGDIIGSVLIFNDLTAFH